MNRDVFRSNRCPVCGGSLKVYQENHYVTAYDLLPDGAIDEASEDVTKCFDDDSKLELCCESCGTLGFGCYDGSGAYFEGELDLAG